MRRYYPFGQGSGERVKQEFGLPHLIRFPILPELSEAGDGNALTRNPLVMPTSQRQLCEVPIPRNPPYDACLTGILLSSSFP